MSEAVEEDSTLRPEEKQVSFVATKDSDAFRVHSEVKGVTHRLLSHPAFEEERRRTQDGAVVSITGTLPAGCLKVRENPRQWGTWATIISEGVLQDGGDE